MLSCKQLKIAAWLAMPEISVMESSQMLLPGSLICYIFVFDKLKLKALKQYEIVMNMP
jgi:hypothetical protein